MGAKNVTIIEKQKELYKKILANKEKLKIKNINVLNKNSLIWLENCTKKKFIYNIIFIDPPYQSNLIEESIRKIYKKINKGKKYFIYLEKNNNNIEKIEIKNWNIIKTKKEGKTNFLLLNNEQ